MVSHSAFFHIFLGNDETIGFLNSITHHYSKCAPSAAQKIQSWVLASSSYLVSWVDLNLHTNPDIPDRPHTLLSGLQEEKKGIRDRVKTTTDVACMSAVILSGAF